MLHLCNKREVLHISGVSLTWVVSVSHRFPTIDLTGKYKDDY